MDFISRLTRRFKIVRFGMVSVAVSAFSLSLLYVLVNAAGWPGWAANLLAVNMGAVPAYLLNRYWVWNKTGHNHFWGEVVPFWAMTISGMVLSTLAVDAAIGRWQGSWVPIVANLLSYFSLWFVKFLLLDHFIFGRVRPLLQKTEDQADES